MLRAFRTIHERLLQAVAAPRFREAGLEAQRSQLVLCAGALCPNNVRNLPLQSRHRGMPTAARVELLDRSPSDWAERSDTQTQEKNTHGPPPRCRPSTSAPRSGTCPFLMQINRWLYQVARGTYR